MRFFAVLLLMMVSALVCEAQMADNFSDGDYTNNPTWTTDNPANWIVIDNQLRSNNTTPNTTFFISTPSDQALNAQWEFSINLQFNTSGVNFVDVYLMSSNANMNAANGYFVRIGGTPDEVSLYKSSGGTSSILINGVDGVTNSVNNVMKVRITRDATNLWKLERDVTATGNSYVTEGTATDDSFTTSFFFGIRVTQSTASFFQRHYFDDFYVGPIVGDVVPPVLTSLTVLSATQLELIFNESLETISAERVSNYFANNGIGNPTSALLQADTKTLRLTFASAFANGIQNQLTISGVSDVAGNSVVNVSQSFLFFQSSPTSNKGLVITEIYADPDPQIGLPDAEFIEIFNRSKNPIDLNGWKLSDGSSTATFASQIILPNEYWIVTAPASVSKFSSFGKTIGLANFPTLNNSTDMLTLKTSITIDSVSYNSSWYRDEDKAAGGWSLELIDPNNVCGDVNNWIASDDSKGGTPGKQNSVFANKPDVVGPKLLSAIASPTQLTLTFDERLEKPLGFFSINILPVIAIANVALSNAALTEIKINLSQSLATRQLYLIEIGKLRDCAGNFIQDEFNQLTFALPEPVDSVDLVVNEVLFNPRTGGVDFVELYNQSEKFINLKNIQLGNFESGAVANAKIISSDYVLSPRSYIALTTDPLALKTQYVQGVEKNFLYAELPRMNDDEGSIALVRSDGKIVDYFLYSNDFHSPFLKDTEGVSLERISSANNSNEQSNWKSASSASGFATPGYVNSNARPVDMIDENAIQIEPQIFAPSQPGRDFSKINYRFLQSGLVANIKIFDQQGRQIKTVANNEMLGFEGFYRWDGDKDDGGKARLGYYVVWFEVVDAAGATSVFRKRIVIAGQ